MKNKLLIVDDERDLCALLKTKFEAFGFEVFLAHDGNEACRIAIGSQPDCILLDVRLDKGDGLSVLRKLRAYTHENLDFQNKIRSTPVLIVTGTGENMRSLFEIEGANDYVEKPFDSANLKERILKHVRNRPFIAEAD